MVAILCFLLNAFNRLAVWPRWWMTNLFSSSVGSDTLVMLVAIYKTCKEVLVINGRTGCLNYGHHQTYHIHVDDPFQPAAWACTMTRVENTTFKVLVFFYEFNVLGGAKQALLLVIYNYCTLQRMTPYRRHCIK